VNVYKITRKIRALKIRGSWRLANYLSILLLPKMKPGMIIKTLYGFKMKIDPVADIAVERSLFQVGSYEEGTLDVISKIIKEGDTFVDIGANIGLMSLFVAHLFNDKCNVIAFEPNPKTREILDFNVNLNNFRSIKVERFAIGSQNRTAKIYDRWDAGRGSASLIQPETISDSFDIIETSLDDYFSFDTNIALIKIDIEGYELNALKGAIKILSSMNPPALIIEYSDETRRTLNDAKSIYYFLVTLNHYRLFKPKIWKGEVGPLVEVKSVLELPVHDNIYCFTITQLERIPKEVFEDLEL